jgi:hypothetical protein
LASTVAARFVLVGIAVTTNYWRNAFFETFSTKTGRVLGLLPYHRYLTQWLTIRWRRWLTAHYLDRWLDGPVHYRATFVRVRKPPSSFIQYDRRRQVPRDLSAEARRYGKMAIQTLVLGPADVGRWHHEVVRCWPIAGDQIDNAPVAATGHARHQGSR